VQELVVKLHLSTTALLTGLIWMVQVVHYPSFLYIDTKRYMSFQKFHMSKIGLLVGPLMIVELLTGIQLLYYQSFNAMYFNLSMLIMMGIWILTAIVFTSIHEKLTHGFNEKLIFDLVNYNWIRTVLWTARLVIIYIVL